MPVPLGQTSYHFEEVWTYMFTEHHFSPYIVDVADSLSSIGMSHQFRVLHR
jgi:hypothetical protein